MRYFTSFLLAFIILVSCKDLTSNQQTPSESTSEEFVQDSIIVTDTSDISTISEKEFYDFKVLDSKYIDASVLWEPFNEDLKDFTESFYNSLKPFILEQDIPTIQKNIADGKLSYEQLTKFYLYRIRKFDRKNELSLNSIIALNPNIIGEAKQRDQEFLNKKMKPMLFGMPILLKDNINASGMPTTAGAVALENNNTEDAFIVQRLKENKALILGKANLSEWAYFFCGDCPSGYSAIGGQTLNPYGRKMIDTGGSSSGSGVAVAANFCVAAVGSETSGSILSPSSKNSVVGLKPTIGLLSRSGIVPISSTLDTPGPMTKNVVDNAYLLDAMFGVDKNDSKTIDALLDQGFYTEQLKDKGVKGRRFGAFKKFMEDSLYVNAIAVLKNLGAEVIEIEDEEIELPDFLRLLNLDMKKDLPVYLSQSASDSIQVRTVNDIIDFNKKDSINRMPYGQKLFEGIVADSATDEAFEQIKNTLKNNGQDYLDEPMNKHNLNGILSINNYHAGFAAVAEYPVITIPMGYDSNGEPEGLTIIVGKLQEKFLLQWAYDYEQASKMRKLPKDYN
ncbi:MAG TPA: amidase family protein [Flavobacteriaceae bacterium]|nr:amidase family protein [Flavobacteriaceae bacterium]